MTRRRVPILNRQRGQRNDRPFDDFKVRHEGTDDEPYRFVYHDADDESERFEYRDESDNDPYGLGYPEFGIDPDLEFSGFLDHDPELHFEPTRWYDPTIGRWINEEPIAFAEGDVNVSRYVGNEPE